MVPTDELSPLEEKLSPLASVEADERKDEQLDAALDEEDELEELEELEEFEELKAAVNEELEAVVDEESEADQSPLSSTSGLFNLSTEEEEQFGGAGAGVSEAESRRRSRSPRRPRARQCQCQWKQAASQRRTPGPG